MERYPEVDPKKVCSYNVSYRIDKKKVSTLRGYILGMANYLITLI